MSKVNELLTRLSEILEQCEGDLHNEALSNSQFLLARSVAPDGRPYQIQVTLQFDEYDFLSEGCGEVEI